MSAEVAVRAAVIEALRGDAALMAAVHAVHDGEPARAAAPHAHVGECLGADWGGKDVAGRELRLTIGLTVADETPARLAAMIARIDPALGAAGDVVQISVLPPRVDWQSKLHLVGLSMKRTKRSMLPCLSFSRVLCITTRRDSPPVTSIGSRKAHVFFATVRVSLVISRCGGATSVLVFFSGAQRKSGWAFLESPIHSPPITLPALSNSRMYS
mgnify:CR=1 FL=1